MLNSNGLTAKNTQSGLSILLIPGVWLLSKLMLGNRLLLVSAMIFLLLLLKTYHHPLADLLQIAAGALSIYLLLVVRSELHLHLNQLGQALERTTQGDLSSVAEFSGQDELADMGAAIESMNFELSAMVAHIRSNTALVAYSGKGLANANRELSGRTEQQAASLEQTMASVQQLSETVSQTARTAQEVSKLSARVHVVTEQGRESMSTAVASMIDIQTSSRRVHDIVGVIDGIAFQTNILALNAAVEAARAGEQGRGFAVVASEVRTLAQRSAAAAKEIKTLIRNSSDMVDEGVQRISSASDTMGEVLSGIRDVSHNIGTISLASVEQSTSLGEISQALVSLEQITQQNAKMVELAAESAGDLRERAGKLADAVSTFRLRQGTAEEAVTMVERAQQHYQKHGQRALPEFNAAGGDFIDRDLYLFGIDDKGVYRVFGGQPAKVSTRMQDVAGIDGTELVRKIKTCVADGGGWVEYNFSNPVSGKVQPKMSYVMRCGELNLGCGVYKTLVA
jgi:methyl-accepting chemotaxis protein